MKKRVLIIGVKLIICAAMFAQATNSLNSSEKELYELHEQEIKNFVKVQTEDETSAINSKYKIAPEDRRKLVELIEEKELRIAILNYTITDDALARYKEKQLINNNYQSKLLRILLLNGARVSSNTYCLAIKFQKQLNLTNSQIDSIVNKAVEIKLLIEKKPKMDIWSHEYSTFSKVLSEVQLDKLLEYKNLIYAAKDANLAWGALKKNNETEGLDSVLSVNQTLSYYLNLRKAADLYKNNNEMYLEAKKTINDNAPIAIRRLNKINSSIKRKSNYTGVYTW